MLTFLFRKQRKDRKERVAKSSQSPADGDLCIISCQAVRVSKLKAMYYIIWLWEIRECLWSCEGLLYVRQQGIIHTEHPPQMSSLKHNDTEARLAARMAEGHN